MFTLDIDSARVSAEEALPAQASEDKGGPALEGRMAVATWDAQGQLLSVNFGEVQAQGRIIEEPPMGTQMSVKKRMLIYGGIALGLIVVANVYALFGHGIRSRYMDWMFLLPLLLGGLACLLVDRYFSPRACRWFLNFYHTGIACLTLAALLQGICQIAGTDTLFCWWFAIAGCLFLVVGIFYGISRTER